MPYSAEQIRKIHSFKDLLIYLEEKLDWPLQRYQFDELTFEYQPEELGLKDDDAAKVKTIHQLRPLRHDQPWGIFFVEFENKKLPVLVLRRILSHLVVKKRASANRAGEAAWHSEDLMFITTFGEDGGDRREIAFAHFHQSAGDLPTLHVLGWDGGDTPLKLVHLNSDLQRHLRWPDDEADHNAWRQQWANPFRYKIGHVINTASALAEELAGLARSINERALKMLAVESEKGPLRMLYKAFQTALIHDLTEESFADTYAQTITYGLLTAAISRAEWSEGQHGTFIVAESVTDMVLITNPFLKEMLQTFLNVGGRKSGIDFDELGIQDVVELLRCEETDLPAILRDFGNRTPGEDPVIHFYEHFLSAYNKKLKIQRGVFYTPQPVVSYIIRSVHELLQTEFGLEDGLASTITWGEMIKKHSDVKLPILIPKNPSKPCPNDIPLSSESPFVIILDIATGTGTFLVEAIDVIHKTMQAKWQKQGKHEKEIVRLWNDYVPKHLLTRLYGYELMMAPYAIAHMKIGLKLSETGYKFMSDERVRVYLTNTLEPASDAQSKLVGIIPALAHEAEAVNTVKRNVRFTVVVGNPPYAVSSVNKSKWIEKLSADYKKDLNEQNIQPLSDDYIKFIRFGQHFIDKNEIGVLAYISNNGFIEGIIHRQMRKYLLECFDKNYILDLHGNAKKKEVCLDGSPDNNVFDIMQGVSINIFVKTNQKKKNELGEAFHYESFGLRETKYELLNKNTLNSLRWNVILPITPNFFLVKKDFELTEEYGKWLKIDEIFTQNNSGLATEFDEFVVQDCFEESKNLLHELKTLSAKNILNKYKLDIKKIDKIERAINDVKNNDAIITTLDYRPFDYKYTIYTGASNGIMGRPRDGIMKHMINENLALLTCRQQSTFNFQHAFVSNKISERCLVSLQTSEVNYVFPIYLYPETTTQQTIDQINVRTHNLNPIIVKQIAKQLDLNFTDEKETTGRSFTPIDVLDYVYAVLHSPAYRSRYTAFLKIDFPRIPLAFNLELFRSLAKLGGELVALHLLESLKVNNFITRFTGNGDNSIPKKPIWKDNAIWINPTQRFEGVPEDVWNFHIGGYQVCEKWLKDRKGRTLSDDDITHYQRIVVALSETIRIMVEIDRVIDEHGGWPGAFSRA